MSRRHAVVAAAVVVGLSLTAGCTSGTAATATPEAATSSTSGESTSAAPRDSTSTSPATPYAETVLDPELAVPAPPVGAQGVAETFDDPSVLAGWRVSYGEPATGAPASVNVADGALRIVSSHSSWLDNGHGTGVARGIDGDVTIVVDVMVEGTESADPTVDWSLAGVMLRAPGMQGREGWLHWTAGYVGGRVLERKATVNGHSVLTLIDIQPGPVRLQLIRIADKVILLHRQGDEPWQRDAVYGYPEEPSAAEVLLTAQSGFEAGHADMVALFDSVTITPGAPSPAVVAEIQAGDTSDLAP